MRVFILRARKSPSSAERIHRSWGDPNHFEIIPGCIQAALFVSKHLRTDTILHVVLEGPPAAPWLLSFDPGVLGYLGGFHETALAGAIMEALTEAGSLSKGESKISKRGIISRRMSFEALIKETVKKMPVYMLSPKGTDIRKTELPPESAFILSDHIGMQKKSMHLLKRLEVKELALGPRMLFASHCIVLVHNELDRCSTTSNLI